MSLSNYFFDYDAPRWPRRLRDQNFGLTLTPNDLLLAADSPVSPRYRDWAAKDVTSTIKSDADKFTINVDVQHFTPEEIVVKVVEGNVIVEGKHEEKKDEHGFVSRQFSRRFKLPEECSPDNVQSRLSSDGVLTVVAPKKVDPAKNERTVPITPTGPVRTEDPLAHARYAPS